MPLVLNEQQVTQRVIDAIEITGFHVVLQMNMLRVMYSKGYTDNGQFVPVEHGSVELTGDQFAAVAAFPVVAGTSLYDNIKAALYGALTDALGTAGTVS